MAILMALKTFFEIGCAAVVVFAVGAFEDVDVPHEVWVL